MIGISEVTGFPEMMDGRVKPCTRRCTAGSSRGVIAPTISRRSRRMASRRSIWWPSTSIRSPRPRRAPDLPFDDLIEEIDIGGPSLVRAAAKNFRDVLVVVDPGDYDRVLEALAVTGRSVALAVRFDLARRALAHTAAYDTTIAATLGQIERGRRPAVSARSGRP